MNSKNLTFLLLSLIAFTQASIISITPLTSTVTSTATPVTVSSYIFKTKLELDSLKKNPDFDALITRIKKFWENSMSEILGEVVAVEEQVANGINRRVTFEVKTGFTIKKVLITVNLQPWASIMKVIATIPTIPGGIADSDLTRIVLPRVQSTTAVNPTLTTSGSVPLSTVSLNLSKDVISGDSTVKATTLTSTTSTTGTTTYLRSEPVLVSTRTTSTTTTTTAPRI